MKPALLFLAAFILAAGVTLLVRTARHQPYAEQPAPPAATVTQAAAKPVNTVCALCGMTVDPSIPTATYQGKQIGFGCRACPPRFAAEPDRYGPAALRNEVVED